MQPCNLVLADSDGTLVWSSNTTGESVSGLNLTETGNLVLFDTTNRTVWQSFDHPTDCLLPGQNLVSGQKLTANLTKSKLQQSVSADNSSQGLFSLTVLNGSWATYIDSDPPQYYYTSDNPDSPYWSFDGHILTALQYPPTSIAQYIQLGHDGHLRIYQLDNLENNMLGLNWKEVCDILTLSDCGYPMVCGRYSICANEGQCTCPVEVNFFRPFSERKPNLGGTELTPISCVSSQYHSLVELKNTAYFSFEFSHELNSSVFWIEGKKIEDCQRACLSNCSCKAAVYDPYLNISLGGNCLLLNEVFSLMDVGVGTAFLKRSEKHQAGDFLDLEPILLGILTRFSYNELKIITDDFSRKPGKGGFGS
ncbi:EP1-like glycoprotein 2, partial [Solanum stenotomum]|uniref:EP1-like glycoprotein 2 n=1 Tax=Solanum stenotomum TaxID=172797 RepID=UPI0020D01183